MVSCIERQLQRQPSKRRHSEAMQAAIELQTKEPTQPKSQVHTTIFVCSLLHKYLHATAECNAMKTCAHLQLIRWDGPGYTQPQIHRYKLKLWLRVCLPLDKQLIA